jgi:hypothetical protein
MYGVLYFFIGFLSNLDDIPVLFALEERFDVFEINILTVLLGSAWATRFIFGFFVDWYVRKFNSYQMLLLWTSLIGIILWFVLAIVDIPNRYVFVALLFFGEVNVCNLKTIVDAMCAGEKDEDQMVRAVRFRLYGRLFARAAGASLSWLAGYRQAFITLCAFYIILFVFIMGQQWKPLEEPEKSDEAVVVDEAYVQRQQRVRLLFLVVCLFWAIPTSDRTQDLWYIQELGYEENDFIYPVLISDLASIICTIGKDISAFALISYMIFTNMVVYVTRTWANTRGVPHFDSIFLVLAYTMWGVLEGRISTQAFILVADSNEPGGNSATRLAFYDSIPVIAGGIGYGSTLLLLHLFDIRDENYTNIAKFNLTCTGVALGVGILSTIIAWWRKEALLQTK